jgi:hypothetical protein
LFDPYNFEYQTTNSPTKKKPPFQQNEAFVSKKKQEFNIKFKRVTKKKDGRKKQTKIRFEVLDNTFSFGSSRMDNNFRFRHEGSITTLIIHYPGLRMHVLRISFE